MKTKVKVIVELEVQHEKKCPWVKSRNLREIVYVIRKRLELSPIMVIMK